MYCTKCGSLNSDSNLFCEKCGFALRSMTGAGETAVLQPSDLQAPNVQQATPAQSAESFEAAWPQPDVSFKAAEPQPVYRQEAVDPRAAAPQSSERQPAYQQKPYQQMPYQQAPYQQAPYQQTTYQQAPYQQTTYQQTPVQQVVPPVRKADRKKKSEKKRTAPPPASTGIKAATVLLCIAFCLFFVLTSFLGLARQTLTEDTLSELLEEIDLNDIDDVEELLDELGMEDAVSFDDNKSHSVADLIYENLTPEARRTFSKRTIRNALEDKRVRDFLIDCILGYTQYYTDGERLKTIDAEDIADFVDKNIRRLSDGEISSLSSKERNDLIECLNDNIDFEMLSRSNVEEMVPIDSSLSSFLFSPLMFWLLLVITVLIFAGIVVLNLRNICACVPKLGVALIVVGALELLLSVGCLCITLFVGGVLISLISPVFTFVATYFALPGAIALALGLLAVIGGKALKKKEKAAAEPQ